MNISLDSYDLKARIAPTILILLPLSITISIIYGVSHISEYEPLMVIGISTGIFLIIVYFLSFFVQFEGETIQKKIWDLKGGSPTRQFLKWSNSEFSQETKQKLYDKISRKYKINISSVDSDLKESDQRINDVITRICSDLHVKNPGGVSQELQVQYGFLRNLFGCKNYWVLFTLIGLIISLYNYYLTYAHILLIIFNFCITIAIVYFSWNKLPKMLEYEDKQFAKYALNEFLSMK